MKTVIAILQKLLVAHFYKVNAGLFMCFAFIVFGLPYDIKSFHLGLVKAMINSQAALSLAIALWAIYYYKCISNTIRQLKQPQQQFLFVLNALPGATIRINFLWTSIAIALPVLAYAAAMIAIAIDEQQYWVAAEIACIHLLFIYLLTATFTTALQRRFFIKKASQIQLFTWRIPKPLFSLSLWHIVLEKKQVLIISKLISLLLLYGFFQLYEPSKHDIRPLLHAFMLVVIANATMVYHMVSFSCEKLLMTLNYPIALATRFAGIVAIYFILLLPELAFIWKGYPTHFWLADYPQIVLFGIGLLLLLHGILLSDNTLNMDHYLKMVFLILAILFFVILYNPGIVLPVLMLAVAYGFHHGYFYSFERKV